MSDADIAIDDHLVEQGTFSESSGEEAARACWHWTSGLRPSSAPTMKWPSAA
jgi:DNA-binding LacI/PurR family transcriptional regulator